MFKPEESIFISEVKRGLQESVIKVVVEVVESESFRTQSPPASEWDNVPQRHRPVRNSVCVFATVPVSQS